MLLGGLVVRILAGASGVPPAFVIMIISPDATRVGIGTVSELRERGWIAHTDSGIRISIEEENRLYNFEICMENLIPSPLSTGNSGRGLECALFCHFLFSSASTKGTQEGIDPLRLFLIPFYLRKKFLKARIFNYVIPIIA